MIYKINLNNFEYKIIGKIKMSIFADGDQVYK